MYNKKVLMSGLLAAALAVSGPFASMISRAEETQAAAGAAGDEATEEIPEQEVFSAADEEASEEAELVGSGESLTEEDEQTLEDEAQVEQAPAEKVSGNSKLPDGLIFDPNPNSAIQGVADGIGQMLEQLKDLRSVFMPAPIASYEIASDFDNLSMVYYYLTQYMGLNDAAACGVLANIRLETGASFAPDHREGSGISGVNGTRYGTYDDYTGYGLCQWTSASRKKGLYEWTSALIGSGSYGTLFGQLSFMWHEMSVGYGVCGYASFYDYLKYGVRDTEEGAYQAAYWMCAGYEMPYYYNKPYGAYDSESDYRGEFAKQLYWPVFEDLTDPEVTEDEPDHDKLPLLPEEKKAEEDSQDLLTSAREWQVRLAGDPMLRKISEHVRRYDRKKAEDMEGTETQEETEAVTEAVTEAE